MARCAEPASMTRSQLLRLRTERCRRAPARRAAASSVTRSEQPSMVREVSRARRSRGARSAIRTQTRRSRSGGPAQPSSSTFRTVCTAGLLPAAARPPRWCAAQVQVGRRSPAGALRAARRRCTPPWPDVRGARRRRRCPSTLAKSRRCTAPRPCVWSKGAGHLQ